MGKRKVKEREYGWSKIHVSVSKGTYKIDRDPGRRCFGQNNAKFIEI